MMLIAALLLLNPACVKQPDWIESTLGGPVAIRLVVDLEQEGPKVKGTVELGTSTFSLEGRVGGDVFHFRARNDRGAATGEVTVSGDEMEGTVTTATLAGTQTVRIFLRRAASPPRR